MKHPGEQSGKYYREQQVPVRPRTDTEPSKGRSGPHVTNGVTNTGHSTTANADAVLVVDNTLAHSSAQQSTFVSSGTRAATSSRPVRPHTTTHNAIDRKRAGKKNALHHYGCGGGGGGGAMPNPHHSNRGKNAAKVNPGSSTWSDRVGDRFASVACGPQSSVATNAVPTNDCCQCEYVFVDGQLLAKFECTHKPQQSQSSSRAKSKSSVSGHTEAVCGGSSVVSRSSLEASTNPCGAAPKSVESRVVGATRNKAKANNNRNATSEAGREQSPQTRVTAVQANQSEPSFAHNKPCIIGANTVSLKKFVKAHIVFDSDLIDVIPLVPTNNTMQPVASSKLETFVPEPQQRLDRESKVQSMSSESAVCIELEPVNKKQSMSMIECDMPVTSVSGDSDWLQANASVVSPPTVWCKPVQVNTHELSTTAVTAVGGQSQTVKKVRCLIANYITVQVEEEVDTEHSDHTNTSDHTTAAIELNPAELNILQWIDPAKLGYHNFEGKNIGLYKNIGYINRNKAKFVRPTEELLQLLLCPRLASSCWSHHHHTSALTSVSSVSSVNSVNSVNSVSQCVSDGASSELKRNLRAYYDLHSDHSYSHTEAYSVLEALIHDHSDRTAHIKARKYHYPHTELTSDADEDDDADDDDDHECASDVEDTGSTYGQSEHLRHSFNSGLMSVAQPINSECDSPPVSFMNGSIWLDCDRNADNTDKTSNDHSLCKLTAQVGKHLSGLVSDECSVPSNSNTDSEWSDLDDQSPVSWNTSSSALDDQLLYDSYYITEVSFSAN